jgi:hypothetical protein
MPSWREEEKSLDSMEADGVPLCHSVSHRLPLYGLDLALLRYTPYLKPAPSPHPFSFCFGGSHHREGYVDRLRRKFQLPSTPVNGDFLRSHRYKLSGAELFATRILAPEPPYGRLSRKSFPLGRSVSPNASALMAS